jgi:hypothetical protein
LERQIFGNSFNLCPLTQMTTLGTACMECEYMTKADEEFFCICDEDANEDQLSVKEIINLLLDLLLAGHTTINRDEIVRLITDM